MTLKELLDIETYKINLKVLNFNPSQIEFLKNLLRNIEYKTSISDIEIIPVTNHKSGNNFYIEGFPEVYFKYRINNGKESHNIAETYDMAMLLALGEKYEGCNSKFGSYAGRMLNIKSAWTKDNMKVIVILEAIHPNCDNWIPIKIFKYSHENLMIKVPEYIKALRRELKNNIGSNHLDYEYVALNMEVSE